MDSLKHETEKQRNREAHRHSDTRAKKFSSVRAGQVHATHTCKSILSD